MDAEWHNLETAHGKGSYDGVGSTIKECNFSVSLATETKFVSFKL